MKIVCDSCGAKYSIADEKVAGKIFKIRCKKCASVLEVRGDQAGTHPFGAASSPPGPGGEPSWYIVVDGEQRGPLRPIELSQLFAKGSVGLDSYVWKEGFDDWKAAGDVPDLAQVLGGAAAQAKSVSAGASPFSTGGDLFSDTNGREPTSEVDTSMFSGFDERPTPTGSQDAPLAAASDRSGSAAGVAGFGGGAMGAPAPQRMTGQRNENSVLFSLTNLQQLASRGGSPAESAPAAASPRPASALAQAGPQAVTEGSGLIDIRALAKSTTPGGRAAPSQAVEDLLAIGTGGGGAALGTPLFGPAPLDNADGNRWLWIGGAAIAVIAIVGAGVGVGMALGGSDDDALEITASAEKQASQPMPGSSNVATAAQAPADPPEQALANAEPVEAATIKEPAEAVPDVTAPAPTKRTSSTSQRRQRTSRSTAAERPAPKKRSGSNLDALMDEVVGGSSPSQPKQATRSSSSSSSNLPDAPTRNDVKRALQGVSGAVKACGNGSSGTAAVNVAFSGKTGRVASARVTSGPFKGTAVGSCIASAVKRARVPRFKQTSFKVTFPYRL